MGGFSGRLGTAVGYQWNGKWCLRSLPGQVRNPRTEAQVKHRQLFKQEVQLAARMRWVLTTCLTEAARAAGMTAYNLFVSLNQPCFGEEDGQLAVDYARLRFSSGPVAPVAFTTMEWTADNVLTADFERNPLHLSSNQHDRVHLYLYAPALGLGYLAAPVYRSARRVAASLPDAFAGCTVHLYGMVQDEHGRWSETVYAGSMTLAENAAAQPGTADGTPADSTDNTLSDSALAPAPKADYAPGGPAMADTPPHTAGVTAPPGV